MRLAAVFFVAALAAAGPAHAIGPITIGDGPASPYPSTVPAGPSDRVIEGVDVILTDLDHEFPEELDIALTGPGGRTVMLMSDVGADGACLGAPDLRFTMQATDPVPDTGLPCSGSYLPTDHDPEPDDPDPDSDLFAAPAPAEPFAGSLAVFNGLFAGAAPWSLRVMDDTPLDGGAIADWRLSIDTRQTGRVGLAGSSATVPETQPTAVLAIDRAGGSSAAPLGSGTVTWTVQSEPCAFLVPPAYPRATAGEDFATTGGSVAFGPGATRRLLAIELVDDRVPESTECIRVALTGASGDARLQHRPDGSLDVVQLRIANDDRPVARPAVTPSRPQRVLRRNAVVVAATSRADGTLAASGRIAVPRQAAASVRLKPARPVAATAGRKATLRLGLGRKARRTVRRAFRRKRVLVATVKVTATDLAGGRATRAVRVRLRR